jgi:hypothetical protein
MPNWCENKLQVTGFENGKETQAFFERHKGEGDLSFEKAAPYPQGSGWDYDWCCENWGTKWDADGAQAYVGERDLTYHFETAWSPPLQWLKTVAAQYPKLRFTLRYDESSEAFMGFELAHGKLLREECFELYPSDSDEELLLLAILKNIDLLASLDGYDSKVVDLLKKASQLLNGAKKALRHGRPRPKAETSKAMTRTKR